MEKEESVITLEKDDGVKFKDKLKQWYIANVANNGETIRKVYDVRTTVENTAGSVAFFVFLPEFSALIPAIQGANKFKNNLEYDIGKKAVHAVLHISPEELNVKPASDKLGIPDDKEIERMTEEAATSIFTSSSSEGRSL